jgi:hypothetical protein
VELERQGSRYLWTQLQIVTINDLPGWEALLQK